MPVNPYDDCKVSLQRPHGNSDLDIVRASYTRRKANVTEAYVIVKILMDHFVKNFSFQLFKKKRKIAIQRFWQ